MYPSETIAQVCFDVGLEAVFSQLPRPCRYSLEGRPKICGTVCRCSPRTRAYRHRMVRRFVSKQKCELGIAIYGTSK
jgi:hypothetical protein